MILNTLTLSIALSGIQEAKGTVYVAVYNRPEDFMKTEKAVALKTIPVAQGGQVECILTELLPGSYAVSAYHDLNNNGKLDKNALGIPTEPYGFSNKARPKFRAPRWDEAQVDVRRDTRLELVLEKW